MVHAMSLSGVQTSKHSLEQHNKLTCGGVDGVDGVVDIDGVVDVDGVDCSRVCVVGWSDLAGGQWDVTLHGYGDITSYQQYSQGQNNWCYS